MASKGEYDVQPPNAKDNSMRMCIMTLLIFFFICVVLLIIPLVLKNDTHQEKVTDDISAAARDSSYVKESTVPPVEEHSTQTTLQTSSQQHPVSKQSTSPTYSTKLDLSSSISIRHELQGSHNKTQGTTTQVTIVSATSAETQTTLTSLSSSTVRAQNTSEGLSNNTRVDASHTISTTHIPIVTNTSAETQITLTTLSSSTAGAQNTSEGISNNTQADASHSISTTQVPIIAITSGETHITLTTLSSYTAGAQNTSEGLSNNTRVDASHTISTTHVPIVTNTSAETLNTLTTLSSSTVRTQNTSEGISKNTQVNASHSISTTQVPIIAITSGETHITLTTVNSSTAGAQNTSEGISNNTQVYASHSITTTHIPIVTNTSAETQITLTTLSSSTAGAQNTSEGISNNTQVYASHSITTTHIPIVTNTSAETLNTLTTLSSSTAGSQNTSEGISKNTQTDASHTISTTQVPIVATTSAETQITLTTLSSSTDGAQNTSEGISNNTQVYASHSIQTTQIRSVADTSTATPSILTTLNSSSTIATQNTFQSTFTKTQENASYSNSTTGSLVATGTTPGVQASDLGKECRSGDCKNLAGRILVMMNHAVEKCEDYYEFACGGLRSYDLLMEDDPASNAFYRIEGQLQKAEDPRERNVLINAIEPFNKYYKSCINYYDQFDETKRLEKAKTLLDNVGKFHEDFKTFDTATLTDLIYNLMIHHSTPLFNVLLDVDTTDTSKFSLVLETSSTPFVFKTNEGETCSSALTSYDSDDVNLSDLYTNYTQCVDYVQETEYIKELSEALKKLNVLTDMMPVSQATEIIRSNLRKVMANETIAKHETLSKKFEMKTIKELKTDMALIDWERLFNGLLNRTIPEDTRVQVYSYENFKAFFGIQLQYKSMKLYNAALGMFAHDLYFSMVTPTQQDNRGGYCLELANSLMEEYSSALYLNSFSTDELQTLQSDLEYIFENLKETLKERVESSSPLDDRSKTAVVNKVDAMKLATPPTNLNETYLHQRLSGMNIVIDESNFFDNTITLLKRHRTLMYEQFDKDPHAPEQMWSHFILPYDTIGKSIYALNTVAVPLGIAARRRNFHQSGLQYLKHAYLGGILGRLVARHFSVTGVKYDATGHLKGVGSLIDAGTFETWNETYFVEQLQVWPLNDGRNVSLMVDDDLKNLWLDELMADQSGLKLALETYRRLNFSNTDQVLPWLGMDTEELFFLSAAQVFCTKSTMLASARQLFEDEHLPSPARVNFFISNSYDFKTDICSRGTKMNPDFSQKVVPFPEDQLNY